MFTTLFRAVWLSYSTSKLVYKKFINKGNKKYGPYLYENKRAGDKVVTGYLGKYQSGFKPKKEIFDSKFFVYILLGVALLFLFLISYHDSSSLGRVTLNIYPGGYVIGEPLTGIVKLNLKAGEFIPQASTVLVTYNNVTSEYNLSSLVNVSPSIGNFYAENADINGSGEGYGVEGTSTNGYPTLSFQLSVTPSSYSNPSSNNLSVIPSTDLNQSNDIQDSGNNTQQPVSCDNSSIAITNNSTTSTDNSDSTTSPTNNSTDLITGDVISSGSNIVTGTVSESNDFVYYLQPGQTVTLVSGSVSSSNQTLDDSAISLFSNSSEVDVATNYSSSTQGYGANYLGDYADSLSFNLSDFNLNVTNSTLSVRLSYQGQILASDHKDLASDLQYLNEHITINNSLSNLTLIRTIPTVRFNPNSDYTINLSNYFNNSQSYSFTVANITASFNGSLLTLVPDQKFRGMRIGQVTAYAEGQSVSSNQFNIFVVSGFIFVNRTRNRIEIGKPVQWTENVASDVSQNLSIQIPEEAGNISIQNSNAGAYNPISLNGSSLTGNVVMEIDLSKNKNWLYSFFMNLFGAFTGHDISNLNSATNVNSQNLNLPDNSTDYVVSYTTPAPVAVYANTSFGVQVNISAPTDLNYTDILSYSYIPEFYTDSNQNDIQLYWVQNNSYLPFTAYDLTGDGKIDYIEWDTPHLSNQTFDIILASDAEELDSNRNVISDIYSNISMLDGITAAIPAGNYLRVTFQENLTNQNDITFYGYSDSNAQVNVYEENSNVPIATFDNITSGADQKYRILLTNLTDTQNTFDLQILNSTVYFDYVVDPSVNVTIINSCQNLNVTGTYILNVSINNINGNCFNVTANNVLLNGNRHNINGTQNSSNAYYGIYVNNVSNFTLYNISISNFGDYNMQGVRAGAAIFFNSSTNYTIGFGFGSTRGITINSSYIGLYELSSTGGLIQGNNFSYLNDYGVYLVNSSSNSFYSTIDSNLQSDVYLVNSSSNSFYSVYSYNDSQSGFYLSGSSNNTFSNVYSDYNNNSGVFLTNASSNNTFFNFEASNNSVDAIYDDGKGHGNYLIYNNANGSIVFTGDTNNLTVHGNLLSANNLVMNYNLFYVNTTALPELNISANITFDSLNLPSTVISPILLENGVICSSNVCTNSTSLTSTTNVMFNVSSWGAFSVGQLPSISSCGSIIQPNSAFTLSGNITDVNPESGACILIDANNIRINGNGFTINGNGTSSDNGISISNENNITIFNITISNFSQGLLIAQSNSNNLLNVISDYNLNYGLDMGPSNFDNLSGIVTNDNGANGIEDYNGNYNLFNNITSSNNSGSGLSINSPIKNMILMEIILMASNYSNFTNIITNDNGGDGIGENYGWDGEDMFGNYNNFVNVTADSNAGNGIAVDSYLLHFILQSFFIMILSLM